MTSLIYSAFNFDSRGHLFQEFNTFLREALVQLFQTNIIQLDSGTPLTDSQCDTGIALHNILPVHVILETSKAFYLVQPFFQHTLEDCVVLSPAILGNSFTKALFILYQILQAMRNCHEHGIPVGNIRLSDILIDEKLWVHFAEPSITSLLGLASPMEICENPEISEQTERKGMKKGTQEKHQKTTGGVEQTSELSKLVQQWVEGKMSNFDYLMALNSLAGRKIGDPNNHPVLPWVIDFSKHNSGFRDLSKSKFRLNKGDRQLDLTFETSPAFASTAEDLAHVPHHISDVLSDITYYVYKARRTPKSVLCAHVRSKWVPHEYPHSMRRLHDWTPDECIPEFFMDPAIFTSIHEDLPDLEVPSWCRDANDFIAKHMAVLESEWVTRNLHHWIDLTFGFKVGDYSGLDPYR